MNTANQVWLNLSVQDWKEAFQGHPRIGGASAKHATKHSLELSRQEQSQVTVADSSVLSQLREKNEEYEQRFGFTFIVCATGKSAATMLSLLLSRLRNDPDTEVRLAAEQQSEITELRMRKWLAQ